MPGRYCVVVGCHNSGNGLNKWRTEYCSVHQMNYGTGRCICDPPFRLFTFPTELQNPEGRLQWTKNVNRQDVKTGKMWSPSQSSRVCSKHFVDGEPTPLNPYPTLFMTHSDLPHEENSRNKLKVKKHYHPVTKIRKISTENDDSMMSTEEDAGCSQMEIDREPVAKSKLPVPVKKIMNEEKIESTLCSEWYPSLEKALLSIQAWETFVANFKNCSTDEDRVRQLYDITQVHDILKTTSVRKVKSAEESVLLRDQGNQVFKKGYKQRALDLYNLSVLKAPTSDETSSLALALANRSAVLLHMKHYRLSLQDIESSFKSGYPDKLKYKLLERKGKCYFQMNEKDKAKDAFEKAKICLKVSGLEQEKKNNLINDYDKQVWHCEKLERPPSKTRSDVTFQGPVPKIRKENSVINSMSDALAVLYTTDSGRGLVAMRDVEVGELLVVEKPFCSTLLASFSLSHCNNCCKRVIAPVPCVECCEVVYCNDGCRNIGWEGFHKYECEVLSSIREAEIGLGHLAVRTVLKAGLDKLCSSENKVFTEKEQIRAGFDSDGMYDSQNYHTVYNLVNHTADRTTENLIKHALEALYLLKCIEKTSFFHNPTDADVSSIAMKFVVGGHILQNLQMLPCNAHEVSELAMKPKNMPESVTMEIGSAIYPVLSLINHSCDPSVVRHSYGDICVVRAIRNIPKGNEILDNYGALYPLTPCSERREKLSKQYYFMCNCLACQDDFPLYFDTPSEVPVFKCESCLGPVFVPVGEKPDKAVCSSCKMPQDIRMKLAMLAKSDESYRAAIQQVLMDKSGDLNGYIPTLEFHLKLMDRFLCRPWRDYNDCQEALKQCYAVKASHVVVE